MDGYLCPLAAAEVQQMGRPRRRGRPRSPFLSSLPCRVTVSWSLYISCQSQGRTLNTSAFWYQSRQEEQTGVKYWMERGFMSTEKRQSKVGRSRGPGPSGPAGLSHRSQGWAVGLHTPILCLQQKEPVPSTQRTDTTGAIRHTYFRQKSTLIV